MKPTTSYKMKYQTKRFLSRILDPHFRGEVKRLFVEGELCAQYAKNKSKGRDMREIRSNDLDVE